MSPCLNICFSVLSLILCYVRVHIYLLLIITISSLFFRQKRCPFFFPSLAAPEILEKCARKSSVHALSASTTDEKSSSVTFTNARRIFNIFFFLIKEVLKWTHCGFRALSRTYSFLITVVVLLCIHQIYHYCWEMWLVNGFVFLFVLK